MSEIEPINNGQRPSSRNPNRPYIIIAAVLLLVIVVAAVLLITQWLPSGQGGQESVAATTVVPTASNVPTFTPGPTEEPTALTLVAEPTVAFTLVMTDTSSPKFDLVSAGARPSQEWTGFFGRVDDREGTPMRGIWVIAWNPDGQPASAPVQTDADGFYEISLADAPLAGIWTIQLLNSDGSPASRLFSFQTDEDTQTGIQQIQVDWKQIL